MNRVATQPSDRRLDVARPIPPGRARGFRRLTSSDGGPVIPRLEAPRRQIGAPTRSPVRLAHQPRRHNLPQSLTSFIGRHREIATAERLLTTTRLLTLTGPGGMGKTRLGHAVAAAVLTREAGETPAFTDGVWLVELAALADPLLVPPAVAAVLGLREDAKQPLTASLIEALRPRELLLVLDNCEHLIEACAALAQALLPACQGLRILTTSRQPLGVTGETVLPVPPLSLSASVDGPASAAVPEAVQLFVERAQAAWPAFAPTEDDLAWVLHICQRLDGMPLAIELAAARVLVLSPEQIAARLDDRFRLLTGGSRTALPRYRTLRALIDWSHDLLDEPERVLLRRLSVFADGWTLDAAEAVCADISAGSGRALVADDVLDCLAGLVAKSLVQADERTAEVRYRFLETIREYAAGKLREAGEEDRLRERHLAWVLALAERAEPELTGPRQDVWLHRLDRERENLRAAQRWAIARDDGEAVVRFGAALWQFWHERADAADARELIDALVRLDGHTSPSATLARALRGVGLLAGMVADYPTCRLLLDRGLTVARQLEDQPTLAVLLDTLGRQAFVEGRYPEARALLNEGLAILRQLDDRHALARGLSHLGFLEYLENRSGLAREIFQEGLALARAAGDASGIAEFQDNLGRTAQAEGDLDTAIRAYREAVTIWRETNQSNWLAMALNNLGSAEVLRGEVGSARAHLEEAFVLSQRTGNRRRLAFTLAAIATLAAVQGEPERAVRLDAATSSALAAMGATLAQPAYAAYVPHLERSRQALGAAATAHATAAGQALTLDAAVTDALTWLADPGHPDHVSTEPDDAASLPTLADESAVAATPTASGGCGLSPRELEVAALVARGLTNRQIAEALIITEGTASSHVKHILARLGLDSRVQIATWAVAQGLHQGGSS